MTRSIIVVIVAVSLTLSFGIGWAEDVGGKVQSVNVTERSFTLDDGTQIYLAEGIPAESIKEGSKVKVTFEERDGKKVATTVEVAE
jgi:hypothetical protein